MDITSRIIEYEGGEMHFQETVELFAELIRLKLAWSLQGHYGRMAEKFIELGVINEQGEINQSKVDSILEMI